LPKRVDASPGFLYFPPFSIPGNVRAGCANPILLTRHADSWHPRVRVRGDNNHGQNLFGVLGSGCVKCNSGLQLGGLESTTPRIPRDGTIHHGILWRYSKFVSNKICSRGSFPSLDPRNGNL
jgi:hypothetical protein